MFSPCTSSFLFTCSASCPYHTLHILFIILYMSVLKIGLASCCDEIIENIFCEISLKLLTWHGKRQDAASARCRVGSCHWLTKLTSLHFTSLNSLTHTFIHSCIQLTQLTLLHSLTHAFTYSTHFTSLTHSPMPSLTNSLTHSFNSLHFASLTHMHSLIHAGIHSHTHSTHLTSFQSLTHPLTHAFTH